MKVARFFRFAFLAFALLFGVGCDQETAPRLLEMPEEVKPAAEQPTTSIHTSDPNNPTARGFDFLRDIPTAPPSQIFDNVGFFQADDKIAISRKLNEISNTEKIHIYLTVIANLTPGDISSLADALNRKWLQKDIGAILVLSFEKSPQIFLIAGGPDKTKWSVTEIERASRRAIKQGLEILSAGDVRGGCLTAIDEFLWEIRKLQGREKPKGDLSQIIPLTPQHQWYAFWRGTGSHQRKLLIATGFISLVTLGATGIFLYRWWKYRPRILPETTHRIRFGAPYTGGNNARVNFGKKRSGQS